MAGREGCRRKKTVEIRRLKDFALRLPPNSPLRTILLLEDEKLDVHTFLARMPVWLRLLRISEEGQA